MKVKVYKKRIIRATLLTTKTREPMEKMITSSTITTLLIFWRLGD